MTLAELHKLIGWQLEGRLQNKGRTGKWEDWVIEDPPAEFMDASDFRRRPDMPPMPDEVWIAEYQGVEFNEPLGAYKSRDRCSNKNHSATPVRYIRADGIIDGCRLEGRHKDDTPGQWTELSCAEYRFKP